MPQEEKNKNLINEDKGSKKIIWDSLNWDKIDRVLEEERWQENDKLIGSDLSVQEGSLINENKKIGGKDINFKKKETLFDPTLIFSKNEKIIDENQKQTDQKWKNLLGDFKIDFGEIDHALKQEREIEISQNTQELISPIPSHMIGEGNPKIKLSEVNIEWSNIDKVLNSENDFEDEKVQRIKEEDLKDSFSFNKSWNDKKKKAQVLSNQSLDNFSSQKKDFLNNEEKCKFDSPKKKL